MRILFQGAGAIGTAGAALFTDRHEVAVVTRTPGPNPYPVYPRRIGWLDPSQATSTRSPIRPLSGDGSRDSSPATPEGGTGRVPSQDSGPDIGWTVCDVAATRRVTVTGWDALLDEARTIGSALTSDGPERTNARWDLVVLSTRPGDLDGAVTSAINELAPTFLAMTSQVDGDLDRARLLFPGSEVVIFAPAFLSERLDSEIERHRGDGRREIGHGRLGHGELGRGEEEVHGEAGRSEAGRSREGSAGVTAAPGREVRYWAPVGAPRFLIAGTPRSRLSGSPRSHQASRQAGTPRSRHAVSGPRGGGMDSAVAQLSRRLGSLVLPVPLAVLTRSPAVFIPFVAELSSRDGSWAELKSHLRRPSAAAAEAVRAATGVGVPISATLSGIVIEALEKLVPFDITEYAGRHFARHEAQTTAMLEGWARQVEGHPASGSRSAPALGSLVHALAAKCRSGPERVRPLRRGCGGG